MQNQFRKNDIKGNDPLAVLLNGGTPVILGSPSFGKGSVQTVIPFKDSSGMKYTVASLKKESKNKYRLYRPVKFGVRF